MTDPLDVQIRTVAITRRGAGGWQARLRLRVGPMVRAFAARPRRRTSLARGGIRRKVLGARLPTMIVAIRRMRTRLFRAQVVLRDHRGSVVHRSASPTLRSPVSHAVPSPKSLGSETRARNESTFRHVSSRFETFVRHHTDSEATSARREVGLSLARPERLVPPSRPVRLDRPRRTGQADRLAAAPTHPAPAAGVSMTHRKPSPVSSPPSETRPVRTGRGAPLDLGDVAPALPRTAGPGHIDVERLTDQVLLKIERRFIAQRERLGIGDP